MSEQLNFFDELYNTLAAAVESNDSGDDAPPVLVERKWFNAPIFTDNDMGRLYHTALQAGLPIISTDNCCRLLAWLYVFGGGNEAVTQDDKLRNSIVYAQYRLNILGGEVPDVEWLPVLCDYIAELECYAKDVAAAIKAGKDKNEVPQPDWLEGVEKQYKVKSGI